MATFDGEQHSVQADVNILAVQDFTLSQVDLLGECMDAANVVAAFYLPVEAKAGVLSDFRFPVEQLNALFAIVRLPVEAQATTLLESIMFIPIHTLQGEQAPFSLPMEWDGTEVLHCTQFLPIDATTVISAPTSEPVEALAGAQAGQMLPVEATQGVSAPMQTPAEAAGTTVVISIFSLPIDAGGGFHAPQSLPIESAGLILINATQFLPVEVRGAIAQALGLPVEAAGEPLAGMLHTRNVFKRLSDPFLHFRMVIVTAFSTTIQHSRNVKNIANSVFPHSRRVLPDIIPLFNQDIQRPYGKAEKQ